MSELSREDRQTLLALSARTGLMWGGVYDRGGEADLLRLEMRGLIESVKEPYTAGKITFSGGYRITKAGRAALSPTLREVDRRGSDD